MIPSPKMIHWCDELRAALRECLYKEPGTVYELKAFYDEAFAFAPARIKCNPFPDAGKAYILSLAALLAIEEFLDIGTDSMWGLKIQDSRLALRNRDKETVKELAQMLFDLRKDHSRCPRPGEAGYMTILCLSYSSFYQILDSQYANGYA